jgi:hypothetical protein
MNLFRLIADMLHLVAILILLYRIKKSRNCIGKYMCHSHTVCRSQLQNVGNLLHGIHDPVL